MSERLKPLIQRSVLEIGEYDYHSRKEMEQLDRSLPTYIMSYQKSGEALLRIYGKEYKIKPGNAIFIPPNVVHDHIKTSKEDAVFLWWHFNFRTSFNIDVLSLLKLPVVVHMKNIQDFEEKFINYLDEIKNEKSIADIIFKNAKAMEVLACILDSFLQSEKTKIASDVSPVFFDILDDISMEPRADMSLSKLGARYHMNPTYISNKFKDYFGISPIYLLRQILIEKAKEYLISSSMSISEIGEELGFSEHAVFTRFFTEKCGVSPSCFRSTF